MFPEPPEIAPLATTALAGIDGPRGCAAFTGTVQEVNHFAALATRMDFTWSATLRDGAWSDWRITRTDPGSNGISVSFDIGDETFPFVPTLFGRITDSPDPDDGVAAESRALFLELLDRARTRVELETVEPENAGWVYRRVLESRWTLLGRRENKVEVTFDPSLHPEHWSVELERTVRMGEPGEGRIPRLSLDLHVDAEGWPLRDAIDVTGAYGLLALRVERTITFVRGACPA